MTLCETFIYLGFLTYKPWIIIGMIFGGFCVWSGYKFQSWRLRKNDALAVEEEK